MSPRSESARARRVRTQGSRPRRIARPTAHRTPSRLRRRASGENTGKPTIASPTRQPPDRSEESKGTRPLGAGSSVIWTGGPWPAAVFGSVLCPCGDGPGAGSRAGGTGPGGRPPPLHTRYASSPLLVTGASGDGRGRTLGMSRETDGPRTPSAGEAGDGGGAVGKEQHHLISLPSRKKEANRSRHRCPGNYAQQPGVPFVPAKWKSRSS
jgi:hypothetical protein